MCLSVKWSVNIKAFNILDFICYFFSASLTDSLGENLRAHNDDEAGRQLLPSLSFLVSLLVERFLVFLFRIFSVSDADARLCD